MLKYVIVAIGTLAIVAGGLERLLGALAPHSRLLLMITGAIAVAAAVFMYRWQKLQKPKVPLMRVFVSFILCGVTDTFAMTVEEALTQPDTTPIIQRHLGITGADIWLAILVTMVVIGAVVWIFRKRQWPHCRGMGGPQRARGR